MDFVFGGSNSGGQGPAGDSAYQVWLDEGNTGTEQDFLDSLVGAQGPAGADGNDGAQGDQGPAGNDGADGQGVPTGGTAGQVLEKIDGTDYNTQWVTPAGGGGGGIAAEPYCVTGSGADIVLAEETMNLTTETVANSNYSLASNQVTVGVAGTYLVSYSIVLAEDGTSGSTRQSTETYIRLNGTTNILQSQMSAYNRETAGDSGCSNTFLVELSADDTLEIRCSQAGADTDISQGATQMSIIRVA